MAQMRVKDQDLIVKEVVSTIENNKLQEFKARKDVQSFHSKIQVKLNDMYVLYKKYAKDPVDVKPFIKQCLDKGGSFIFSKNMCLLFLDTMMSATSTQRNKVCTDIIKYAASSTDLSSFFVKVS